MNQKDQTIWNQAIRKPVNEQQLARSLKQYRLARSRNLGGIAKELKIDKSLLEQFESGDFAWQSLDPIQRGHLRSYVGLVGLDWSEVSPETNVRRSKLIRPKYQQLKSWVLSEKVSRFGVVGVIAVGLVGIILIVSQLFLAPELTLYEPGEIQLQQSSRQLVVSGKTSPGSDVIINNTPVAVGLKGEFNERVFLSPGVNRLQVQAINSLSRKAEREFVVVVTTSGTNQE